MTMVKETTQYVCTHPDFQNCAFSSDTKAVVQYHERRHEMDMLIDRISEVHNHKHFVQKEVIGWLDNWLEHGQMAGTTECQHCGADVHVLFDQCPECHRPAQELKDGAVLRCEACGSHAVKVMQKDGHRNKQGYRCIECGNYLAHGNGYLSFNSADDMGYWDDD
jgi:DNA-directed RNA polymerase subunit RPC12/RpoP